MAQAEVPEGCPRHRRLLRPRLPPLPRRHHRLLDSCGGEGPSRVPGAVAPLGTAVEAAEWLEVVEEAQAQHRAGEEAGEEGCTTQVIRGSV